MQQNNIKKDSKKKHNIILFFFLLFCDHCESFCENNEMNNDKNFEITSTTVRFLVFFYLSISLIAICFASIEFS